jgi:transcriptional regulator with XRE-family HTH domain
MAKEPKSADFYAGSKLRFQRQMRKMSQSDLANAIGVTFQQIQKYEKGINRIGAGKLQTLAAVLGIPVSFFFKNGDDLPIAPNQKAEPSDAGISGFLLTKEGFTLNRHFAAIKDAQARKAIIELVRALTEMGSKANSDSGVN